MQEAIKKAQNDFSKCDLSTSHVKKTDYEQRGKELETQKRNVTGLAVGISIVGVIAFGLMILLSLPRAAKSPSVSKTTATPVSERAATAEAENPWWRQGGDSKGDQRVQRLEEKISLCKNKGKRYNPHMDKCEDEDGEPWSLFYLLLYFGVTMTIIMLIVFAITGDI